MMDEWLSSSHTTPNNAPTPGQVLGKTLPSFDNEQFVLPEHERDPQLHENEVAHFDLDSIDFIMPDELAPSLRAFPPLAYPENTPALLPNRPNGTQNQYRSDAPVAGHAFQSPLLPSQNEESYNEEHLFHKQRQQRSRNHSSTHSFSQNPAGIRPDAVFTPLVSPAVTPLELQINTNQAHNAPMQTSFEPLTSPALAAQQRQERLPSDRRRPLSATFGHDDYSNGGSTKRRTPHSTPNMAAHPHTKAKRLPSLRKTPQTLVVFEQLPDSSYDASVEASSASHTIRSLETTPMLPPQGKRVPIEDSLSGSNTPGYKGAAAGPATLMGFTMNRLAELQGNTTQLSPSLNPRNGHSREDLTYRSSVGRRVLVKNETSLSEPSPAIDPQSSDAVEGTRKREKGPGKKASHKIAEQGRRDRMNQAVHELLNLIPQEYHDQVSIPSKATTIELASKYITALLAEIDELKGKQDLPKDEAKKA